MFQKCQGEGFSDCTPVGPSAVCLRPETLQVGRCPYIVDSTQDNQGIADATYPGSLPSKDSGLEEVGFCLPGQQVGQGPCLGCSTASALSLVAVWIGSCGWNPAGR